MWYYYLEMLFECIIAFRLFLSLSICLDIVSHLTHVQGNLVSGLLYIFEGGGGGNALSRYRLIDVLIEVKTRAINVAMLSTFSVFISLNLSAFLCDLLGSPC